MNSWSRSVSLIVVSTGLVLIAVSFSFPWYHFGDLDLYVSWQRELDRLMSSTDHLLGALMSGLVISLLFGWLHLIVVTIEDAKSAVLTGWLSVTSGVIVVAYAVLGIPDALLDDYVSLEQRSHGLSIGWGFALVGVGLVAVSAFYSMAHLFDKPKEDEEEDAPFEVSSRKSP